MNSGNGLARVSLSRLNFLSNIRLVPPKAAEQYVHGNDSCPHIREITDVSDSFNRRNKRSAGQNYPDIASPKKASHITG